MVADNTHLKRAIASSILQLMVSEHELKAAIAYRLDQVFDAMDFSGRGRQQDIADAFKVSRETVRKWLVAEAIPETWRISEIAQRSGFNANWILTGQEPERGIAESGISYGRRIPVVGRAKGGDRGFFEEEQYPTGHGSEFVWHSVRDPNAFALRVVGDSMSPRYNHDEYIIAKPRSEAVPGDDVYVALKDGRKLIKRFAWRRGETFSLHSINNAHPPITIDASQILCIYPLGGMLPAGSAIEPIPET